MTRQLPQLTNRHAGKLLLVGLAGLAWHTWRQWQREQALPSGEEQPASAAEAWPDAPRVSVLVAAWNEADHIASHIQSFLGLSYPNKQLVLCAGGADGTYALACRRAGPQVMVLEQQPGEGKQRALSRCLPLADGAVIVLSDADCVFSEQAFMRLIEPIVTGQAQVVTGVSEPLLNQRANLLVQYQHFTDRVWAERLPSTVDGVLGRNCALLRSVLDDLQAFDAPVRTGTDYFLSRLLIQAGYQIRSAPTSRIATAYPESPQDYVRMWRRWNKNLLIHGSRFGAWKDVKGVVTACMLYSLIIFGPFLTPLLGSLAWLISALLFGIAGANRLCRAAAGARLAGTNLSWRFLVSLPFYTLLDMLAVLLAFRDLANPVSRSRW